MSDESSVCLKVVEEVADREGVDPTELRPPLHTVVDTGALEELFRSTPGTVRSEGKVEFQYQEYTIRVNGSGEIQVCETIPFIGQIDRRTQQAEDSTED